MNSTPQTLQGKVAIVTGSSRGIGKGIALELARRGAKLTVNYVASASAAAILVKELEALGTKAIAVQADVCKQKDLDALFDKTIEAFGRVDIVASNSGVESFERAVDVTPERFDQVFSINARAQFFVAVTAYRYMTRAEPRAGGRIILTSSIAARIMGVRDHALYAGSKSAVEGITRSLATDFGPSGVTVNAIAPGGVKSDMFADAAINYIPGADKTWSADRIEAAMAASCPLGRVCQPEDIGKVVAWLASSDSSWITGQVILCSGGSSQ
ncbi:NAD(P)-binding protein [Annulohypoxylon bovei var. microspora]|nr:NAD(P)-binding protein [Annulohypoxylon bovei var. microspora]